MNEKHHYYPRSLLQMFCTDKKKIYVHVKKDNIIRYQIPEKVACESNFYSIIENGCLSNKYEKILATIESNSLPMIVKLIRRIEVEKFNLGKQDFIYDFKQDISKLIATLRVRVPAFLDKFGEHLGNIKRVEQIINNKHNSYNITSRSNDQKSVAPNSNFVMRGEIIESEEIWNYADFFASNLEKMHWTIFKTSLEDPYYTTDNPVCFHLPIGIAGDINLYDVFNNMQLQISMPLSSMYCLIIHFNKDAPSYCSTDKAWLERLNYHRVKNADEFIFGSKENKELLKYAREHNLEKYKSNVILNGSPYILDKTIIKRTKP